MANFSKDTVVYRGDDQYRVVRAEESKVYLEHVTTGAYSEHSDIDLLCEFVRGYMRPVVNYRYRSPPKLSQMQLELSGGDVEDHDGMNGTRRRIEYIVRLYRAGAFDRPRRELMQWIKKIGSDLDDAFPPHETTIYRWRRDYRMVMFNVQDIISKVQYRGGAGKSRIDPSVERLVQECIERAYLNSRSGCAEDVYNAVFLEIQRENTSRIESEWLAVPSLRTVQRRIAALPQYDRVLARYGEREARRRYEFQGRARRVSRILEMVEIDHTPLDIIYSNDDFVAVDRPTITVVFDRCSRCVLGFCISSAGRGTAAVFEALRHAFLPKTYLTDKFSDMTIDWPCHGWPEKILMDNGREFHSKALVDSLTSLGVMCEYAASKDPNDKPFVERFIRTLNHSLIHKLPGTTLSKLSDRVGLDSEKEACITFDRLNEIIHVWITSVYHKRPHAGLGGRAPIDVWRESAKSFPPPLKCSADDLEIEFSLLHEKILHHYGIEMNTFRYSSNDLSVLRRMIPIASKVIVKSPPNDAGHIWVWNSIEEIYIRVQNTDVQYAGMTIEQAKIAKKGMAVDDQYQRTRSDAGEYIREKVDEAKSSKKYPERRRAAKMDNQTSKKKNDDRLPLKKSKNPVTVPPGGGDDDLEQYETDSVNARGNHD